MTGLKLPLGKFPYPAAVEKAIVNPPHFFRVTDTNYNSD
jgi:hypothetical protein